MKVKKNLKRNVRILDFLLESRTPHKRMEYCQKPVAKVPKWWSRRLRKREEKRKERLERTMAKFKGTKRLTQKELKKQQQKNFVEGLSKGLWGKLPHFRMLYKSLNISGPLPFELLKRKNITRRRMLEALKKEHRTLCNEISLLVSPTIELGSSKMVNTINRLTREKMHWDKVLNNMTSHLKLLTLKVSETHRDVDEMKVRMTKEYFERKNKDPFMVTQPAYFPEVEYNLYPEKRMHTRKTLKERYFEDLSEIEELYMALEKKGEEVHHYLITRELFISVLTKVQDKLNKGKKFVLDLLQDGHNLMNDLTIRIFDLSSMKNLTEKVRDELEVRRKQSINERAILLEETKELMARHRPFKMSKTYVHMREKVQEPEKTAEELEAELKVKYEMFEKAILIMGGLMERGEESIQDFTKMSRVHWIPEVLNTMTASAFIMQKIPFPLIKAKEHESKSAQFRREIAGKMRARVDLINKVITHRKKLGPFLDAVRAAHQEVRHRLYTLYKTWKYFSKPLRDLYSFLNKKSTFEADKLGIHNRMTEYNKIMCLNILRDTIPYCVAKLIHAEKQGIPGNLKYTTILRPRDLHRIRWKRYQLMKELITPRTETVRRKKIFEMKEYPPLVKSPCPLCCTVDRLSKMAVVEEFEDRIRSVGEIRCELRDTQDMKDLQELNHPIWECKQPAARNLIQLLILEDRTNAAGKIMDFTKMAQ